MDLLASLKTEFPQPPPGLNDQYIEQHPDPSCAVPQNEWLVVMPAYMIWCLQSPLRNELLVLDHTVNALANFGRFDQAAPPHMNFRSLCSPRQRELVAAFLRWCLGGDVIVLEEQVDRSLKQWQRV